MRRLLFVAFVAATAAAQSGLQLQESRTTESLRGVSAVSRQIAWASGTHGTYLRTTNGGRTWTPAQVPGAASLDFRAVVAFSADEAFLMSAGPGDQSRIYHTVDGGQHWQLQFTNKNPKGFFDSMAFWDPKHGIVLGDPVPDESGKLKFELLETEDGQNWHAMLSAALPEAMEGEGAFAASNSCIALLPAKYQKHIWFATGGKAARVFHSPDGGEHWEISVSPIVHGPESAGIFSIAFRNEKDGVIAGGDYKKPDADGPNLAFTHDGGKTWEVATIHPQAYFSAVAYDRKVSEETWEQQKERVIAELRRKHHDETPELQPEIYVVGQEFVLDAKSRTDATRIVSKKKLAGALNAVGAFPDGGALVVGAKGVVGRIR